MCLPSVDLQLVLQLVSPGLAWGPPPPPPCPRGLPSSAAITGSSSSGAQTLPALLTLCCLPDLAALYCSFNGPF